LHCPPEENRIDERTNGTAKMTKIVQEICVWECDGGKLVWLYSGGEPHKDLDCRHTPDEVINGLTVWEVLPAWFLAGRAGNCV
jgi:hypothetical protein